MSHMICRLCLNDGKLIDIFDNRLTNSEQLRKCILLGTGVEICREDAVTKYVCQYCSDLAISLYRYRKKALANDRALKKLANEQLKEPSSEITEIVQSNRQIFEKLEAQAQETVVKSEPVSEICGESAVLPSNLIVHPTVKDLINAYPTLKIPSDLLKCHIQPRVALNPNEVERWTPRTQPEEALRQGLTEFERFKIMCPGIHITKVGSASDELRDEPKIVKAAKPNTLNKRKSTELPIDVFPKKMKTSSKSEHCNSSIDISETKITTVKQERAETPEPNIEKHVPKLKIALRRSPDQSEPCAVVMDVPTNSAQTVECSGIQQKPTAQRKRKTSREKNKNPSLESPAIQQNIGTLRESPTSHITKGSFMESLSMQRRKESPVIGRSREPSVESPAIQDNTENSKESALVIPESVNTIERITPRVFNRKKRIIESDESDNDDRGFDTENLLDTFNEEIVLTCGVCNKMFSTQQQLRGHERVHRRCTICSMIFRSPDALLYHQREICFKKVIANPPNLELVRVDQQPEMVKLYAEALKIQEKPAVVTKKEETSDVLYISDDEDDDVIIVSQSVHRPKEMDSEDYRLSPVEFQFICRIFAKYTSLIMPNTMHKATETKPKISVRYNSRSQIVLENMFSELQSYRVPVELVAKANSWAYISVTKKPPKENNIYCWANEPVIDLNEKTSFLSILLNSQSDADDVQCVPQAFVLAQLNSAPNAINNTQKLQIPNETTPTAMNLPQTSITVTHPLVYETQTPVDVAPAPASIIISQAPINVTQTVDATEKSINVTQTPLQLLQPTNIQSTLSHPIIKIAIPRNPYNSVQSKPSTSNSKLLGTTATTSSGPTLPRPVPSTSTGGDMNFGLRVKTLSELL